MIVDLRMTTTSAIKASSYVLIVMANPQVNQVLQHLTTGGYATMLTQTTEGALKLFQRFNPVLTILDSTLPDVDAVAFCQAAEQRLSEQPEHEADHQRRSSLLVILPAEQRDKAEFLLELGADDVLIESEPSVSPRLLRNRIRQLLTLQQIPPPLEYQRQFLDWVDTPSLICDRHGAILAVNPALMRLCTSSAEKLHTMTLQSLLSESDTAGKPQIVSRIAQAAELSHFFRDQPRIERRVSLWRQDQPPLSTTLTLKPMDQGHYLATFTPMVYANGNAGSSPAIRATATQTITGVGIRQSAADKTSTSLHPTVNVTSPDAVRESQEITTEVPQQGYISGDLFNDANDAILVIEIETGSILNANRLACRWLDYTFDELTSMSIDAIETPLNSEQQRQLQEMMSTTGQLVYEQAYRTRSGALIPVEVSSRIIQYEGANAFLCFARDITRRRKSEEAERAQRSLAEALRASVSVLNNSLDFNDVIEKMLELIDYVVPSDAANVMRIEGTQVQVIAHRGYERSSPLQLPTRAAGQGGMALPGHVIITGQSDEQDLTIKTRARLRDLPLTQWMHRNKLPIHISDSKELRQYRTDERITQPEFRSMIGAPIIVENNVIGFIHLEGHSPNQFNDEDAGRLMAFADQAGIALRNAQLFHRMQNYADELEQRVEERTLQLTRANFVLQEQMIERRKFENALAEERNLLRTLIDTLPDKVYVKDRSGRIVLQNAASDQRSRLSDDTPTETTELIELPETLADIQPDSLPDSVTIDPSPASAIETLRDTQLIPAVNLPQVEALSDLERAVIEQGISILDQEHMWFDDHGVQHWTLETRVPLHDEKGEITGLVNVQRDISALRGAEQELAQVVTGANCLLWSAYVEEIDDRLQWELDISSEEAARHFLPVRIQEDQSYTSAWLASLLPADRKQRDDISRMAIRSNRSHYMTEYRCRRADNEIRWLSEEVRIRPIRPGRWSLVGVCTDITDRKKVAQALQESFEQLDARVQERTRDLTQANQVLKEQMAERKRAEEALRESESRFRALVENAPEAIVVFDVITERYINVNQNAVRLFGGTRSELLTKGPLDHCPEFQPSGAKSSTLMRKYIQDALHGRIPVFEWQYIGADGVEIPCEMRLLLLRDANTYQIRGSITNISERLRAQQALKESEQKYRSLTNQLPVGVYRALHDGRIQFANPTMARILGYDNPEDLIGLSIFDFFHMEDGPLDGDLVVRDLLPTDPTVIQMEHRVRQRNGNIIWVRDTGHIILEGEEIAYIDYICEDITESVNIKQAERKQRLLAEALQAAAEDLSRSLDLDKILAQMLQHVNQVIPRFREATVILLEDTRESARVLHFASTQDTGPQLLVLQKHIDPAKWPIMNRLLDMDSPFVIDDVRTDPDWILVETHEWVHAYLGAPIQVEGRTIGAINIMADQIGAFTLEHGEWLMTFANQAGMAVQNARLYEAIQKHAQELQERVQERTVELDTERARLRAILDSMTDGVVFYDDTGETRFSNRSLNHIIGEGSDQLTIPELWHQTFVGTEEERIAFEERFNNALNASNVYSAKLRLRRRDNYEFDAILVSSRVQNSEGHPIGIVTVIRDVSQETRLEQQKKSFISSASHELRTPLTNLKTRLYLIGREPHRLEEHLQVLETVTNRMRRLVEDLFDISRFEHGMMTLQTELTHLQPLLEDMAQLQQPEADKVHVRIEVDVPETPLWVMVDEPRLIQVMTNLIINAINHTPPQGRIRIDAEIDEATAGVRIGVHDTGVGIPEELLLQIFKPFVRGKEDNKGAGLGLSISKEIIELHGGTISVTSKVNVGTRFEIWLPLYDENAIPLGENAAPLMDDAQHAALPSGDQATS